MKKMLFFGFILGLIACDDGDLEIETIDFDDVAIDHCNNITATGANILFKINGDEALILELQSGVFNNGNSTTDTVETTSTIPSQTKLTYRLFSDNVNNSYFCDDIPPATPSVTEEIEFESGLVTIKSIAVNDSTEFSHTIELSNVILTNASGDRITDLTVSEFGTLVLPIAN